MHDIDKILEKIDLLKKTLGWGGAFLGIIVLLTIYFMWKFLNRKIEKSAELTFEKTIKIFQSQLDRDTAEHNVKFTSLHQKQIDSIQDIYIHLQRLFKKIDYLLHGDKYNPMIDPQEQIKQLITYREEFIDIYGVHKIVLTIDICSKIDDLIPSIDEFVETFKSGIFPEHSPKMILNEENTGDNFFIAGIWRQNSFDETLKKLETVKNEIETEFRNIYGT